MEENKKISAQQLFCLMIMSRMAAAVVFPAYGATGYESALAAVIAESIRLLIALPVVVRAFRESGSSPKSRNALKAVSAVAAVIMLLFAAAGTVYRLSRFVLRNILPEAPMWAIIAIAAVFALYAAYMGTEALARAGALFLLTAAAITLVVIAGVLPDMRLYDGEFDLRLPSLLETAARRVMSGGEYLIFAALFPVATEKKRGSAGRAALWFAFASAAVTAAVSLVFGAALREFYGLCDCPYTAAASLSDIALLKRLDALSAAIWALCAMFRAGVMLVCCKTLISRLFRRQKPAEPESAA